MTIVYLRRRSRSTVQQIQC